MTASNNQLHKDNFSVLAYLEFCKGGSQEVWGCKSPSSVQGHSTGRGLADEVPQKLTTFCKLVLLGRTFCERSKALAIHKWKTVTAAFLLP